MRVPWNELNKTNSVKLSCLDYICCVKNEYNFLERIHTYILILIRTYTHTYILKHRHTHLYKSPTYIGTNTPMFTH